jgi:hypothetical protein
MSGERHDRIGARRIHADRQGERGHRQSQLHIFSSLGNPAHMPGAKNTAASPSLQRRPAGIN